MGFTCGTCREPEFPELERFIGAVVGPCWRSEPDAGLIQGAAVLAGMRLGYCVRHVAWLGELVGWTVRQDAARREVLERAVIARRVV